MGDAVLTHDLTNISARYSGMAITNWTIIATAILGEPMRKIREIYQRKAYAARRASRAIDRMIRAQSDQEKAQARIWANRWGLVAGFPAAR